MSEYWTDVERRLLQDVQDFQMLAEVAKLILAKMTETEPSMEVYQVCGPMSTGGLGNLETNMRRHCHAVRVAEDNGVLVFDQVPFQETMIRLIGDSPRRDYPMEILEIFYHQVFTSGHLVGGFFLPDWRSSRGTTWEMEAMKKLGLITQDYPLDWLEEVTLRLSTDSGIYVT